MVNIRFNANGHVFNKWIDGFFGIKSQKFEVSLEKLIMQEYRGSYFAPWVGFFCNHGEYGRMIACAKMIWKVRHGTQYNFDKMCDKNRIGALFDSKLEQHIGLVEIYYSFIMFLVWKNFTLRMENINSIV